MNGHEGIADARAGAGIGVAAAVPSGHPAGSITRFDRPPGFLHLPFVKKHEGMGPCAGPRMLGRRPCSIIQIAASGYAKAILRRFHIIRACQMHRHVDLGELPVFLGHASLRGKPGTNPGDAGSPGREQR